MKGNRALSRPEEVYLFPWLWQEVTRENATLRASFFPVVVAWSSNGQQLADFLSTTCQHSLFSSHADTTNHARFFVQAGTRKTAGAKSAVPRTMDLSASGAEFIGLGYESPAKTGLNKKDGCYYQYDDRYGYPTIGFGHLVLDGEDFSKGLSSDEVNQLFVKDSKRFVNKVNKYLKVGVSQNQFDALVSLAFNIGGNSEPIRKLNAGTIVVESDFSEYCKVRDPHDKARKVVAKGLLKRRKAEWIIFSKNIYDSRH